MRPTWRCLVGAVRSGEQKDVIFLVEVVRHVKNAEISGTTWSIEECRKGSSNCANHKEPRRLVLRLGFRSAPVG